MNQVEKSIDFNFEKVPTFEIDLHGYWDTTSRNEIFLAELKKLPFYRNHFLYSGFDLKQPKLGNSVFCVNENEIENTSSEGQNCLDYALNSEVPAIAVYDPSRMDGGDSMYNYKMLSSDALIALIKLQESASDSDEEGSDE